ncbi:hypothetical protein OG558_21330 [Kribbella sp. NBC_01510]|uniref:hypothetical protein n=1 Tax=unclassified Kribbella TaxID=2644121 RepID=UPI002E301261|nr:hypothetical protein [Kribbella sp. NBC_01484]
MTHTTNHWMDSDSPPTEGVAGTARDEAGQLKETSADAARQVAGTVKDKASNVTSDVREQTRRLAHQTRNELVGQASQQKDRATNGLRSVSDELRGMAEHGQSGLGAQLARHGAGFADQAADFLQQHEPGDLLDEVRGFARRKPGTFLLVAAAAGVVAGRLTRALAAGGTNASGSSGTPYSNGSVSGNGMPGQPVGGADVDDYLVPPPVAPNQDLGAPVQSRYSPGPGL